MAAVACSLCCFLFNHCHPVTGKRPSPASRSPPAWGLLHRGLADFGGGGAKWLGFQFLQRVFTLYSEISSSPNTQGCQEEVNREASWWVLFLDAGVESIQPAFMLVPSRHFLPPSHRPNVRVRLNWLFTALPNTLDTQGGKRWTREIRHSKTPKDLLNY